MPTRGLTTGELQILDFVFYDTIDFEQHEITTNDQISAAETIVSLTVIHLIILIRYGVQILALPMRTPGCLFTNSDTFGSIITA
jgi:hypothetical protein